MLVGHPSTKIDLAAPARSRMCAAGHSRRATSRANVSERLLLPVGSKVVSVPSTRTRKKPALDAEAITPGARYSSSLTPPAQFERRRCRRSARSASLDQSTRQALSPLAEHDHHQHHIEQHQNVLGGDHLAHVNAAASSRVTNARSLCSAVNSAILFSQLFLFRQLEAASGPPEIDAAASHVIGRQFHTHGVAHNTLDLVLVQKPAAAGVDDATVFQPHSEVRVSAMLHDDAYDLDCDLHDTGSSSTIPAAARRLASPSEKVVITSPSQ
jgi:hypothetical protein